MEEKLGWDYQDSYKKLPYGSPEAHRKYDAELGVYYVPDYLVFEVASKNVLSETNLKFLKVLVSCGILSVDSGEVTYQKPELTIKDIQKIRDRMLEWYKDDRYSDSDLHDDNFELFDIVNPIAAYDKNCRKHFVKEHRDKFETEDDLNKFLANRPKVFCVYSFLRRSAILYRETEYKEPCRLLMEFMDKKANMDRLKGLLRVEAVRFVDDNWNTGLHEWLTCKSTLIALKRTAGMVAKVEPCLKPVILKVNLKGGNLGKCIWSEFNWLDFQFLIRTPTKHVIFNHLQSAHVGGMNKNEHPEDARAGVLTSGQPAFHRKIDTSFYESRTIVVYVGKVKDIYEEYLFYEKSPVLPSSKRNYLSDGTKTDNLHELTHFKDKKIRPSHEMTHIWLRDLWTQGKLISMDVNHVLICSYRKSRILPIGWVVNKEVVASYAKNASTFFQPSTLEKEKVVRSTSGHSKPRVESLHNLCLSRQIVLTGPPGISIDGNEIILGFQTNEGYREAIGLLADCFGVSRNREGDFWRVIPDADQIHIRVDKVEDFLSYCSRSTSSLSM